MEERIQIWERMASDLKPERLDALVDREITLTGLPAALEDIRQSNTRGRILVRLS
ncbi:putative quinone oxidoreductase YhfP [compost metagenome]